MALGKIVTSGNQQQWVAYLATFDTIIGEDDGHMSSFNKNSRLHNNKKLNIANSSLYNSLQYYPIYLFNLAYSEPTLFSTQYDTFRPIILS